MLFGIHTKSLVIFLAGVFAALGLVMAAGNFNDQAIHEEAERLIEEQFDASKMALLSSIAAKRTDFEARADSGYNLLEITSEWKQVKGADNDSTLSYIRADGLKRDDSLSPPISHGDIRMARAAIEGAEPKIEAFRFDGQWYFREMYVTSSEGRDDALWVGTWPVNALVVSLSSQLTRGRITVIQQLQGSAPNMVFRQGFGGTEYKRKGVLNENWQFEVELSEEAFNNIQVISVGWVLAMGTAAIAALLGLWVAIRTERGLRVRAVAQKRALKKKSSAHETMFTDMPHHVFRAYDIRGREEEFSDALLAQIGKAIGAMVLSAEGEGVYVCRDARLSSNRFFGNICRGILSTGCNIIDIGYGHSGLLYYAAEEGMYRSGVMITASHNPKDYNGLKLVVAGEILDGSRIREVKNLVANNRFPDGDGEIKKADLRALYAKRVLKDAESHKLKVVLDAGNGIAGPMASKIMKATDCEVIELFCDPDGEFPNHDPDPSHLPNLDIVRQRVIDEGADLGIALDGDGDRIFAIDENGEIIMPDQLLMIFLKEIAPTVENGKVVYDIKCSSAVAEYAKRYDMTGVICRSGHSNVRNRLVQEEAVLAGELSGHIFFADKWYGFDDGVYAAIRLLNIVATRQEPMSKVVATLPKTFATSEIRVPVKYEYEDEVLSLMKNKEKWPESASLMLIDGVRVQLEQAWGLVRKSNTERAVTFRFEGDTPEALQNVRQLFFDLLSNEMVEVEWQAILEDLR